MNLYSKHKATCHKIIDKAENKKKKKTECLSKLVTSISLTQPKTIMSYISTAEDERIRKGQNDKGNIADMTQKTAFY